MYGTVSSLPATGVGAAAVVATDSTTVAVLIALAVWTMLMALRTFKSILPTDEM